VAERWVSPPLVGREAPSRARAALPFRLLVLVVLLVAVALLFLGYRAVSASLSQDPGVGASAPAGPIT
jgi:hypothetical protein